MTQDKRREIAARELFAAADKLAAAKFPPMTLAEIQKEVDAVRAERRRGAADTMNDDRVENQKGLS